MDAVQSFTVRSILSSTLTPTPLTNTAGLGSDTWLEVSDIDEKSDLHTRATAFVAAIHWENLVAIASRVRGMQCVLSEKYSLGRFKLVRRFTFADGISWVAHLRLPESPNVFSAREAMKPAGEKYLKSA